MESESVQTNLERVLRSGEFAVCGEMGPPQGCDPNDILKKCGHFKDVVDAVNLTDNQTAIVRMSSAVASYLALQGGIEPIMQMTCRDRNRMAQQSEILGAAALGVRNVLCLTGDHARLGNHPEAKPVHDLDSVNLVKLASGLRDGKFFCGDEIKGPIPKLFVGAAANPFGEPFKMRILNLAKKVAAGADFIQTQPVFDIPRFRRWMEAVCEAGLDKKVFILAGIMPVRSVKALLYMKESVPGMSIDDSYIQRMGSKTDKDEAMAEGVAIAIETVQEMKQIPGVAGVHIMPVMWESITRKVVDGAGLLPRPVAPQPEPVEEPAAV